MDRPPTPTTSSPRPTDTPAGRESLSLNDKGAIRPVRNDDYEEDVDFELEDEGELLKAEVDGDRLDVPRPTRPRSGSLHFDFGSGIMLASSQEVRTNRAPSEPIGLMAGVALSKSRTGPMAPARARAIVRRAVWNAAGVA